MMIPLRTIRPISTLPEPKTMALGGVATGSMNAHDAEIVAGTISKSGFTPIDWLMPAMIGSNADEMRIFALAFGIVSTLDETEVLDLILSYDPDDPGVSLDGIVPMGGKVVSRSLLMSTMLLNSLEKTTGAG